MCIIIFLLRNTNVLFIKKISIIIAAPLLYISTKLIYENYYHNYVNTYEIKSFIELIREYGVIVNMFYIFPLILAILYTVFVVCLYFKFRPSTEK